MNDDKKNIRKPQDLDKERLLEVINDINMKDEAKASIIENCAKISNEKNNFKFFGKITPRQAALPALAAVLALCILGYNLLPIIYPNPKLTNSENSSSFNTSSKNQISNSISPIELTMPRWFSPGELVVNQHYENLPEGITFQETLSSEYIFVNAQRQAIKESEENGNCKNFRFNIKTGAIECMDNVIKEILIPAGIMKETDRIYFTGHVQSDEYVLIDIRTSKNKYVGTYRFNLQTEEFIKIKENLNKVENWQIFKDYSALVTTEYSNNEWKIYLVDIVSGERKNIVEEKNATNMFELSPTNKYLWYSIFENGNKDLRYICNISTGEKMHITSDNYPVFTPDDRYVLYFAGDKIRRMNLDTKKDEVLIENFELKSLGLSSIVAYDETAERLILSSLNNANYYDLYSLDITTGKIVHIVDPNNKVNFVSSSKDISSMSISRSDLSSKNESFMDSYESNTNSIYPNYSNVESFESFESFESNDAVSFFEEFQDLNLEPETVIERGASVYIFDKTGKYIFYYTDLHGKSGRMFCYDVASGDQFFVSLPEGFLAKLATERKNLLHPKMPHGVEYRLYLSDDSTHIYLTYEIIRVNDTESIPYSELLDYAKKYNTIVHFRKYFSQSFSNDVLPGKNYVSYTDDGKIAILNEDYSTRKFALIIFDKPFDDAKPYGGGEVIIQKDIPDDANGFLAEWWEQYYSSGTKIYSLDKVINFVKTHDSLDSFTKTYGVFRTGVNFEMETEIGFFYQICVGPNDYVNVTENYAEKKIQIMRGEIVLYERELNPSVTSSDRLPKHMK